MELYEVQATRWYFSAVLYRVVANDQQDAMQRASDGELRDGVIEHLVTSPTWNGEEEYLEATMVKTAHPIFPTDDIGQEHTNCQYIGFVQDGRWDCGHSDLINDDKAVWIQLPLWPLSKSWNEDTV